MAQDENETNEEPSPLADRRVADPLEAVRAITLERHGNLAYIGPIYLHEGPRAQTIARICQVYRHEKGDLHHTRLDVYYFKRRLVKDAFTFEKQATIEGTALDTLVATLRQIPKFESIDEVADAYLLPLRVSTGTLTPEKLGQISTIISSFLSTDQGIRTVSDGLLSTEALNNLGAAIQQSKYKKAAAELRALMNDPHNSEQVYQDWFETHPWVFGTEYVGRVDAREIDIHSKADILLLSVDSFIDLFELKKPTTPALNYDPSRKTHYASVELSKALAQVMHYLRLINENRLQLKEDWGEQVFRPRAIIVVGRSNEWNEEQRKAWRNLRTSLQNIELLTFDHVLARAERLISQYEKSI